MDRGELEGLDREALVVRAQAAGIRRARILTRPELIDELLRLDPNATAAQLRKSRGFFGKARDLVARVVERGLHLPDAADRIRTLSLGAASTYGSRVPRGEPQAMPTVTLAEIYAAQGHRARAIETLRRVLEREPEHAAARMLLARLEDEGYVAPPPPLPPEPENEPEVAVDDDDEDDEPLTVETPFVKNTILGPSDPNGEAEFHLAPPSDEMRGAPLSVDAGRTYTFTAARDGEGIDENAKTDVFATLPEAEVAAEVQGGSRAGRGGRGGRRVHRHPSRARRCGRADVRPLEHLLVDDRRAARCDAGRAVRRPCACRHALVGCPDLRDS